MAPAYKVEELLALRDSVSESAVSLDKFADEVIKGTGDLWLINAQEHVLRPSASALLIGRKSDRSLRAVIPRAATLDLRREITPEVVPTTISTASAAPCKRPSPSSSVKRGKAEQLLKEHGSPPGLRVTAGGRIVPGDLPPLGVRPSFNIYNPQALRAAPTGIMAAQPQSHSNNTARIEVVGGQAIIVVGDRMFALPAVNSTSMSTPLADEHLDKQIDDHSRLSTQTALPGGPFDSQRPDAQTPLGGLDLPTLKAQQAIKKQELRTVEQTEVLQSGHQTEAWRTSMIKKKKSLIVELDSLRKHIAALESDSTNAESTKPSAPSISATVASAPAPAFMPPYQQALAQPMYSYGSADPYASLMMYTPPFGPFPGVPALDSAPFVPPVNSLAHSPGSMNRRSRAIEIKAPHEEPKKQASSVLNPKSPTYEPKLSLAKASVPPTPSPERNPVWLQQEATESGTHACRTLSHRPSFSSVDTTDFFPTNTHEHSSTRVAPTANMPVLRQNEDSIAPATPEKSWPASPWNENNASRSRHHEPAPKIGSWPDAYGKPQSSSPKMQGTTGGRLVSAHNQNATAEGSLKIARSNTVGDRDHSQQRSASEDLWPFNMPRAVAHVPSTYQEGFQAGYDHLGMPDSPEVLQGYVQGLLAFLADSLNNHRNSVSGRESRTQYVDSRTPSLHGLVASSTPHDSAIGMTFSRTEAVVASQENTRAGQGSGHTGFRQDPPYKAQGSIRNTQPSFTQNTDPARETRRPDDMSARYPNTTGLRPEVVLNRFRRGSPLPGPGLELVEPEEKGTAPSSATHATDTAFDRQVSSNQLADRTNTNFQTLLRLYPAHKEVGPIELGGSRILEARPFANNHVSGLDGAMDDLADLVMETSVDGRYSPAKQSTRPTAASTCIDDEGMSASCFTTSGNKGKQKVLSPTPNAARSAQGMGTSSRANTPGSPKKSGEQSPAKAKLEQVTNKFRRSKKDDPRGMSSEEKVKRTEKWKKRFEALKQTEKAEIENYREEEDRRNGGRR